MVEYEDFTVEEKLILILYLHGGANKMDFEFDDEGVDISC